MVDQLVALPLADDSEFDISHELAILHRLADQPQARRRRIPPAWPSVAAITLALGWGGAAYAARSPYTVVQGETLYQIAQRHLGSGTRWVEIAALNGIKDPAKVRAGQAIVLPDRRAVRSGRLVRTSRLARGIGQTRDGVPIVPAGDVVLELPARKVELRPAARSHYARPVAAEPVRPQQADEIVSQLPAPPAKEPVSPWRAVDGAAFLIGAFGVTGLLTRTRSRTGRRNPQAQWQMAALALSREMAAASQAGEATGAADFWGPLPGTDLGRLAATAPAR